VRYFNVERRRDQHQRRKMLDRTTFLQSRAQAMSRRFNPTICTHSPDTPPDHADNAGSDYRAAPLFTLTLAQLQVITHDQRVEAHRRALLQLSDADLRDVLEANSAVIWIGVSRRLF